jgi:hypothetical protein
MFREGHVRVLGILWVCFKAKFGNHTFLSDYWLTLATIPYLKTVGPKLASKTPRESLYPMTVIVELTFLVSLESAG